MVKSKTTDKMKTATIKWTFPGQSKGLTGLQVQIMGEHPYSVGTDVDCFVIGDGTRLILQKEQLQYHA